MLLEIGAALFCTKNTVGGKEEYYSEERKQCERERGRDEWEEGKENGREDGWGIGRRRKIWRKIM